MNRDCARLERRFPKKLLGTIAVALLFTALTWLAYEYAIGSMAAEAKSQVGAVEAMVDPFAGTSFEAKAAYIIDTQGRVRLSKNADAQLPLASLTKIALVLAISEVLPPEKLVTLKNDVSGNGKGDTLPKGTTWTVQDLVDFTLVASSNDGAEALAQEAEGSLLEKYPDATAGRAALWRMNQIAKKLGLSNTYFANVTGLEESATQSGAYGSARDVATLMLYAMTNEPGIFSATRQQTLTITSQESTRATVKNTDEALPSMRNFVLIGAPARVGGEVMGSLAVIGPTRIDYEHTMTAVSYIARMFDKILNESE